MNTYFKKSNSDAQKLASSLSHVHECSTKGKQSRHAAVAQIQFEINEGMNRCECAFITSFRQKKVKENSLSRRYQRDLSVLLKK